MSGCALRQGFVTRLSMKTGDVGSLLYFRISQVPTDRAKLTATAELDEDRLVE
jgi:hypothetical protein